MPFSSSKATALLECSVIYTHLTTHKEKWACVFGKNFIGYHGVCFTAGREILHRISFRGIDQLLVIAIAVTMLTDQGITIRCSVCVTIAIACGDLKVGKDCFENTFCIGLIDQLLNLFRNQFVTLYQGFSYSHNRLTVFLEKTFHSFELGLKDSFNTFR